MLKGLYATAAKMLNGSIPKETAQRLDAAIENVRQYNTNHSDIKMRSVANAILGFSFDAAGLPPAARTTKTAELLDALEVAGFQSYAKNPDHIPETIKDERLGSAYKVIGMAMDNLRTDNGLSVNTGTSLRYLAELRPPAISPGPAKQ